MISYLSFMAPGQYNLNTNQKMLRVRDRNEMIIGKMPICNYLKTFANKNIINNEYS